MGSIGTRRPCCLRHRRQRETERNAGENGNPSAQGICSTGRHDRAHRGSVFDPASQLGLAREDVTDRTTSVYLAPKCRCRLGLELNHVAGCQNLVTSCTTMIVASNTSDALADPRSTLGRRRHAAIFGALGRD